MLRTPDEAYALAKQYTDKQSVDVNEKIGELNAALDSEVTARQNADAALQGSLNSIESDIVFGAWTDSGGLRYRKSEKFVEINIYRNFTSGGASPITISAWGDYSLGVIQGFSTDYSIAFPCLYLDSNNLRQLAFITVSATGGVVITNNSGSAITLKDIMAYNVIITNT